uniref:SCP domain-containing protein n=1 Tax=Acrobeloides nanus TaxID=290746 RepID=A0A914EFD8_9BILA
MFSFFGTKESNELDSFRQEQLEKINSYRKQHGSKPLVLDKTLNAYAQEWSENLAKSGRLAHRPSNKYGENIAMASDPLHHDAAKMWYDEYPQYKFNQPDNNYGALHFSQVVWKACTKLGIGLAKCNDGTYIVVANFDPKGNILGQFKENVQDK